MRRAHTRCCAAQGSKSSIVLRKKFFCAGHCPASLGSKRRCSSEAPVIEAVMFWNEPNSMSHWDFEVDRGWTIFGEMVSQATAAVKAERADLTRVLGGISPIDPEFIRSLDRMNALADIDVVAVHGFPLDWNHWSIDE